MRSGRRRLLYWTAGALVALLLVLAVAPLLFRGRLESALKTQLGRNLDAQVDWSGVGVSLLRDFPNLTLRVADLSVTGTGPFEGDTLAVLPRSRLVLDLGSVVRHLRGGGPVVVRAFDLRGPDVRLLVLEDGLANWDIVRADPDRDQAEEGRGLELTLSDFSISDGALRLENRQAGLDASVTGLGQSLRGDFGRARFGVRSHTVADAVSLRFAGVPYLSRVRLDVVADLDVDGESGRIEVRDNRIRVNDLLLELAGSIGFRDEVVALDLTFSAPGTDFGEILSLVPAVYAREFETVRTSGTMAVSGWVRGDYGRDAFPALEIGARVEQGTFRYPDLPLPARDIALDLSLTNPGGDLDHTVLDIRRFNVVLGDDPVGGSLRMRTPVSDPDIDVRLAGRIDLASIGRTFKVEAVEELSGVVVADASIQARLSDVEAERYDRIGADGTLTVSDLLLRTIDLPHPLLVEDAGLRLSPRHAEVTRFRGRIGASDITLTGRLENLLGFALRDEVLRGEASITSGLIALDEWRSDDEMEAVPVPANIDFALDARLDRITFGDLDMRNARGSLLVRDQRLTLQDFRLELLGGAMTMAGFYETIDPAQPVFDMDLRLADLDVAAAFGGLSTVRAFAPVARYAVGHVSADLRLNGALGPDLAPVHEVLSGLGSFQTRELRLQDFPPLDRLAEVLQIPLLSDPGFVDVRSTLVIRDGRLHVNPFDLRLGDIVMHVAGSNGIDQSLDYTLGLEVPRAALGTGAERVVASLISQTGRAGIDLQPSDVITLGARLSGTVGTPTVAADFRGLTASVGQGAEQALREEAGRRVEAMEQRLDAAAEEARLRADAELARAVEEAERRAETIRAEARALAETVRREGNEQADALLERANTPTARLAARPAADRLRREAEDRANRIIHEADARADALVNAARTRSGDDGPH
jgi:hypothetical protein